MLDKNILNLINKLEIIFPDLKMTLDGDFIKTSYSQTTNIDWHEFIKMLETHGLTITYKL